MDPTHKPKLTKAERRVNEQLAELEEKRQRMEEKQAALNSPTRDVTSRGATSRSRASRKSGSDSSPTRSAGRLSRGAMYPQGEQGGE